jgi:1-aminocyclopropane-1-carboxylate deaminase/D-cysteine desulfhydrase-like pyridoxal-dependent ACC family enzyme
MVQQATDTATEIECANNERDVLDEMNITREGYINHRLKGYFNCAWSVAEQQKPQVLFSSVICACGQVTTFLCRTRSNVELACKTVDCLSLL